MPAFAVKPLWKTTTASVCLNVGEPPLELHVDRPCVPAIVRTDPEPTPNRRVGLERASRSLRMRRQAEVVVRREVDDLTVIEGRLRLLLVVEDAQLAVQALLL